jgi:hypothetical protein
MLVASIAPTRTYAVSLKSRVLDVELRTPADVWRMRPNARLLQIASGAPRRKFVPEHAVGDALGLPVVEVHVATSSKKYHVHLEALSAVGVQTTTCVGLQSHRVVMVARGSLGTLAAMLQDLTAVVGLLDVCGAKTTANVKKKKADVKTTITTKMVMVS